MQEKALQYAREMQKRAQSAGSGKQNSSSQSRIDPTQYGSKQHSDFNNRSNFNNGSGSIKNIFSSENTHNQSGNNDITLILSLILLLSSDGGDKLLMLALLYIMT